MIHSKLLYSLLSLVESDFCSYDILEFVLFNTIQNKEYELRYTIRSLCPDPILIVA